MTHQQIPLGDRFDPFGTDLADPYRFYALARREEPVFYSERLGAWVLTRYADVHTALTRTAPAGEVSSVNALQPLTPICPQAQQAFARGLPSAPEPITSDGSTHQRLRAPLARALSATRVDAAQPLIHDTAATLVDGFGGRGHAELMDAYARPLPLHVIGSLFAIEPEDLPTVQQGSYDSVATIASAASDAEQVRAAQGMGALMQLCARYAKARRLHPGADLISQTVAALTPGDAPLTDQQAAELGRLLGGVLIAGHTTTTAAIGAGVHALLAERGQWAWLCRNPDGIPGAVEEIFRFSAPVQLFRRRLIRPLTLSEVTIPAGADLLVAYGAANRDPNRFPDPDRFDIRRQPSAHLTFGAGPHYCLGAHLARAELTTSLQLLTQRLPSLRLVEPEQQLTIQPILTARGPAALHVTW